MDKRLTLLKLLHERTLQGKLAWKPTPIAREYTVEFSAYVVGIVQELNEDADNDYVMCIVDAENNMIDEIYDEDLEEDDDVIPFILMQETFREARRIALGLEAALDSLIAELGEDPAS